MSQQFRGIPQQAQRPLAVRPVGLQRKRKVGGEAGDSRGGSFTWNGVRSIHGDTVVRIPCHMPSTWANRLRVTIAAIRPTRRKPGTLP
ncbi:hypothetical protein ACFV9E_14890 [Streptomyces sp. NPDC059835]|uniref:hypothetical protein n=1 Tax=Streptomyces sp. NPDC059835 TaxID=3346967 RepID=UPI0036691C6C